MPGMPGGPGTGFGGPPAAAPPPVCQQLLAQRDELQKHAAAINRASERKAPAQEACKLFRTFLAAEVKMIKAVEENGARCGAPPEVLKQMREGHAKASQVGKNICDAAAQGGRPAGPSLSDALGTTPSVPDVSSNRGGGAFDTLTGSALGR